MIQNDLKINREINSIPPSIIKDKKKLKKYLGTLAAQILQEIAQDNEYRINNYQKDLSLLKAGIWMPNDYYKCLKNAKQTERLNYFVKNNYFYQFYAKNFTSIVESDSPTGYAGNQLILKEDVLPADAFNFKENLFILDCTAAKEIAYYKTLLIALGKEKFNKLFSHSGKSASPIALGSYDNNPLNFLIADFKPEKENKFQVGHMFYFHNVSLYATRHQGIGDAVGFNTICIKDQEGAQKFVGLGLPSQGVTEKEIKKILIDAYNSVPTDLNFLTDELAKKILLGSKEETLLKYNLDASSCIPLTEEEAEKDSLFGYKNRGTKLNIKLIKILASSNLRQVSLNLVTDHYLAAMKRRLPDDIMKQ